MAIYNKRNKLKVMCGSNKIKKGYYMGNKIYSSGNMVTYYVDNGSVYNEEFDEGENVLFPKTFTPLKSGAYKFAGWRTDNVPSADVLGSAVMADNPITLYAVFERQITLSYNGNGNTEGSVSAQAGTLYYNNGNYAYPAFTLAVNGFTKDDHTFCGWAMGNSEGTRYASGTSVTLSSDTTFYAKWHRSIIPFDYTGGIQTFSVPYDGTYQLEVWGAEGGYSYRGNAGGLGGYAKGNVYLTAGTNLYIVVGGAGTTPHGRYDDDDTLIEVLDTAGGYNGGGTGADECGTGGGATHIGVFNSTLAEHGNTSGLYIVAGGGGGGKDFVIGGYPEVEKDGGNGGGETGGRGYIRDRLIGGGGGTQYSGGDCWIDGGDEEDWIDTDSQQIASFGQGGNGYGGLYSGPGGGGGLYGGGYTDTKAGAGGGSGYIGGVESGEWGDDSNLRSGNGAAKITLLNIS